MNGSRSYSEQPYELDPMTASIGHNARLTLPGVRSRIGSSGHKLPLTPNDDIKSTVTDLRFILGI